MLMHYLTHPQVQIDPEIPVPSWSLNDTGAKRVSNFIASAPLNQIKQIISSAETKAIETATPIAKYLNIELQIRNLMHENDRSSTGFLPPEEFEHMADRFFAKSDSSIEGWERAIDAQCRIVTQCEDILDHHISGDILVIGHGAVGTLLYCHYKGLAISRNYDQQGAGNYFTMRIEDKTPLHHWVPMEQGLSK